MPGTLYRGLTALILLCLALLERTNEYAVAVRIKGDGQW